MIDRLLEGYRVVLDFTDDPITDLEPGDEGTIKYITDDGCVHVDWDKGSWLTLLPEKDCYKISNYSMAILGQFKENV
jgi:hypothetical protein